MPEVITKHPAPPPARGALAAAFPDWGFGAMLPAALAGALLLLRRRR